MQENKTIARPYARAAFEQAQAQGQVDKWAEMLAWLAAAVSDPQLHDLIGNPRVPMEQLAGLLEAVCAGHLVKDGPNFIRLLAMAGRLNVTPEIHEEFERKRALAQSIAEVEIITAFELDQAQRDSLSEIIARRLKRKVDVSTEVDQSIIGGVIIRSGDSVIDASVRGRLRQMSNDLAT